MDTKLELEEINEKLDIIARYLYKIVKALEEREGFIVDIEE
jgi:hypothetical protein